MEDKKYCYVLVYLNQETLHLKEELAEIAISNFECDGIEEFALEEKRVDEILGERAYSGGDIPETLLDEVERATESESEITIKFFFYEGNYVENASGLKLFIDENFPGVPNVLSQKDYEDWNQEWRKFYSPIIISENLEVIPEWLKEVKKDNKAKQVYIYPGMGFGTGTHETTYLCLKLFDEIRDKFIEGMSCLDFGCGSGILGIAGIITNNLTTTFCDIDKNALDNCVQNLVLNFEGKDLSNTQLVIRDRYSVKRHNLVFANILESVLLLEKNTILDSLEKNGWLIVSGLLNNQVDNILNNYTSLKMIKVISKGDWSAILFRNENV